MALELCLVLIDDFSEPLVKEMYFDSSFSSVTPPPQKKKTSFLQSVILAESTESS